jgi:signal transduction histidine kinase
VELEELAATILQDSQEIDEIVSSLENCGHCSTMLLNLINDLMDLAKLEKMKFSLNNCFFDLTKTIESAFGTLSYFGKQKNIKPTLKIEDEIQPYFKNLFGDETRFTQIFLNFLSNAFKFTPNNGDISVEIRPVSEQFCQKIQNEDESESRWRSIKKSILRRGSFEEQ